MTSASAANDGFRVCCECGRWLPVAASAAGAAMRGPCGWQVIVPSLEEFRGRPDLLSAATLERRVRRLIKAGEVPPYGGCAGCGCASAALGRTANPLPETPPGSLPRSEANRQRPGI